MAPFLMPDLSHAQGIHAAADFAQAKPVVSAFMFKATQGVSYEDPSFESNVSGSTDASIPWGAYHWVTGDASGKDQASYVHNKTGERPAFFCIDWEHTDPKFGTDAPRTTVGELLIELRHITSKPVAMYSGVWARGHGGYFGNVPTLVPEYGTASLSPAYRPPMADWAGWQYTNGTQNGTNMPSSIPGIGPCDISVIYLPGALGLQGDDDVAVADMRQGSQAYRAGQPLPANANADFTYGYNLEKRIDTASQLPAPSTTAGITVSQADQRYALKPGIDGGHTHSGKVDVA